MTDKWDERFTDDEIELMAQDRMERRHRRNLIRHPHCGDPEHPGCQNCVETEEEGPAEE